MTTPVLSNSLTVLAKEVRDALNVSASAEKTAISAAIVAGRLLNEAKAGCQHGDWLPFLSRARVPERTAQRYMRLASSGLKPDTVSDLGGIKATLHWLEGLRLPELDEYLLVSLDGFAAGFREPVAIVWRDPAGFLFSVFNLNPGDAWADMLRKPIIKTDMVFPSVYAVLNNRHSEMSFAIVKRDQDTARAFHIGGA